MLRPSTSTSPAIGRWNPATIFSSVVLPQPLGPSSDTSSPGRMSSVMSLAAVTAPNRCVMLRKVRAWPPPLRGVDVDVSDTEPSRPARR